MQQDRDNTWWARPCGGREVLAMALPLVISTASWAMMHFIDRMFLIWHSTQAVAAAMPAGLLHFTIVCLPMGVASYANTFVAQYEGAGRPERIGRAVFQAVLIGLIVSPLFLATIPLAPWAFAVAGHEPEITALEIIYYQTLCFGAGGAILAAALSSFFTGRGRTRTVMLVNVAGALLNIGLDYLWIFGHGGFPAMGIRGAAWATVVAQWAEVLAYVLLMLRPAERRKYQLISGLRFDAPLMGRLLRYGGPNGLQMLLEVAAFSVFILLVGRLGRQAMAATTLAFNVNTLAFVPMLGLGVGLSTIVGHQLGRDNPGLARRATWTSFQLAAIYMGTMALLYVLRPGWFLFGYAAGANPGEFAVLRDLTVVLLRFVAAYCLFDAMNVIFVSTIKGAGDTRFVLATTLITAPTPVLVGWIGVHFFGLGLIWCWVTITVWICALGLIYLARFLQGCWQHMRVIEPAVALEG